MDTLKFFFLSPCLLVPGITGAEVSPSEAWEHGTRYDFSEARLQISQLPHPTREDRLGSAVMLLNVQPVTNAQLDKASVEFEALVTEDPNDEPGLGARFYLGRLAQVHRRPPEPETARRHYHAVIALNPSSLFAEQARLKLAFMVLYSSGRQSPGSEELKSLEHKLDKMVTPEGKRDLHIALGRAGLFYRKELEIEGFDARPYALDHLRAAESTGICSFRTRAELLVAIGELANDLGQTVEARKAYEEFVRAYSRDARAGTIRLRLAKLSGSTSR